MATPLRSADVLVQSVLSNPETVAALKVDPATVLNEAADNAKSVTPAYQSDVVVYRMVVGFLGSAVVLVIVSYAVYPLVHITVVPDGLVAIGSAAVGALAGLLAPSPAGH
jgi:hypothetical protein